MSRTVSISRARCTAAAASLLLSLVAITPAFAQSPSAQVQKLHARFDAADTDHDGKLTLAEAQTGMPRVAKAFDQIDTTHTGTITFDQLIAFIQTQRGG
jgi:uncharacterized protein YcbK (DUF882 family)